MAPGPAKMQDHDAWTDVYNEALQSAQGHHPVFMELAGCEKDLHVTRPKLGRPSSTSGRFPTGPQIQKHVCAKKHPIAHGTTCQGLLFPWVQFRILERYQRHDHAADIFTGTREDVMGQ